MRDVLLPLLFHVGILLRVVIAIGHTETALHCLCDVARTVLCVLAGAKIEKRIHADRVQVRNLREHILSIFDHLDFVELVLQWLGAHRFDRLFVHSAGVIVSDLLCFRCELRIDRGFRRLLGNDVQRVAVALDQLIESAPSGIFRRDLGAFDPRAVGIAEEIVTGLHGRIHVLRIERRLILCDLRLRPSEQAKRTEKRNDGGEE